MTFRPPRISSVADATIFLVKPTDSNTSLVDLSQSYRATSKWSNETKRSPFDFAAAIARWITFCTAVLRDASRGGGLCVGRLRIAR